MKMEKGKNFETINFFPFSNFFSNDRFILQEPEVYPKHLRLRRDPSPSGSQTEISDLALNTSLQSLDQVCDRCKKYVFKPLCLPQPLTPCRFAYRTFQLLRFAYDDGDGDDNDDDNDDFVAYLT